MSSQIPLDEFLLNVSKEIAAKDAQIAELKARLAQYEQIGMSDVYIVPVNDYFSAEGE